MTVIDIIRDYLKAKGYDGLTSGECGCGLDDLHPCCESCFCECKPAYLCKEPVCYRADDDPGTPLYCTLRKWSMCKTLKGPVE